jgi:hypothetical protein
LALKQEFIEEDEEFVGAIQNSQEEPVQDTTITQEPIVPTSSNSNVEMETVTQKSWGDSWDSSGWHGKSCPRNYCYTRTSSSGHKEI